MSEQTNMIYIINNNELYVSLNMLSSCSFQSKIQNMQSELPPARHLIGIKCHLSYKGLHEKEPNYEGGSLSSQDHKSHTNMRT